MFQSPNIFKNGFTLVELLIVIALVVLIMALAVPFGVEFLQEQRIEEETATLANNLKAAQTRAMAGKNDSAWGIKFFEDQYVLFAGESYETRLSQYDEAFQLSSGTNITGAEEIIFEEFTGRLIME
jgi:prepilin-type N-terminal cleavage/methylation domain-containing protein